MAAVSLPLHVVLKVGQRILGCTIVLNDKREQLAQNEFFFFFFFRSNTTTKVHITDVNKLVLSS